MKILKGLLSFLFILSLISSPILADIKVTELPEDTAPTGDDLVMTVTAPATTPASRKVQIQNISHTILKDIGSLTHATIDSYLNQAVKTTSGPSFVNLILTTGGLAMANMATITMKDVGGTLREVLYLYNDTAPGTLIVGGTVGAIKLQQNTEIMGNLTISGTVDGRNISDDLNQAVQTGSSPTFVTAKLTNLTDGYLPYHIGDATGLGNSPIFTDGSSIGIGISPQSIFHVYGVSPVSLLSSSGAGVNQKAWGWFAAGDLYLRTHDDAGVAGFNILKFVRGTGTAHSSTNFYTSNTLRGTFDDSGLTVAVGGSLTLNGALLMPNLTAIVMKDLAGVAQDVLYMYNDTAPSTLIVGAEVAAIKLSQNTEIVGNLNASGWIHGLGWVNAKKFGAVGDGTTNDSTAITNAVNSLGAPGGIVYLPSPGKYLLDAGLTVPANVTVKGPHSFVGSSGTYYGAPSSNMSSIILNPLYTISLYYGAGLDGVFIYRKGMTWPVADSSAFSGTAITLNGDHVSIKNSMIIGFNKLIYGPGVYGVSGSMGHRISDILGDGVNGLEIINSLDVNYVTNVHLWPLSTVSWPQATTAALGGNISGTVFTDTTHGSGNFAVGMALFGTGVAAGTNIVSLGTGTGNNNGGTYNINISQTVTAQTINATGNNRRTGIGIKIDHNDWGKYTNCFTFGYFTGFNLYNTGSVTLLNCGADNVSPPLANTIGFLVSGTSTDDSIIGGHAAAYDHGYYISTTGGDYDTRLLNCDAHHLGNSGVYVYAGNTEITGGYLRDAPYGITIYSATDLPPGLPAAKVLIDQVRIWDITSLPIYNINANPNVRRGINDLNDGWAFSDIQMRNNMTLQGKDTGGIFRNLIGIGTDNGIQLGYAAPNYITIGNTSVLINPVYIWVNGESKQVTKGDCGGTTGYTCLRVIN